jgi:hypothetical protein
MEHPVATPLKVAAVATANVLVWSWHEVAAVAAVFLSVVSSLWVLQQMAKHAWLWYYEWKDKREQLAKKEMGKKVPTDFGGLSGSGD